MVPFPGRGETVRLPRMTVLQHGLQRTKARRAVARSLDVGRSPGRSALLAVLLYVVIDFVYFGVEPLAHLGRTCACGAGSDPTSYMWFLAWWPHALLHGLNPFTTNLLFAPDTVSLGAVDLVPGPALLATPVTLVFGPLVAYNVLALLAPVLAAFFAFLLCRYVSGSTVAGLIGGYIYGFSPYMLGHMLGHLDLVMTFPIPAAIHLTLRLVDGRIHRRAFVPLMALVLAFQFLSQPELTLMLGILGVCALAVSAGLAPAARPRIASAVPTVALAGGLAAVVTSPFIYAGLTGPVSARFFNGYSETYVADSLGFLTPTPVIRLGRSWFAVLAAAFTGNLAEDGVYIGIVLALVLVWFAVTGWRRPATRILTVMFGIVVVLQLGAHMHIAGHPTVPLPWGVLDRLPLLRHVAPVRLGIYMYLIVALAVALWVAEMSAGQSRRGAAARWVAALVGLILLVPNVGSGRWHSVPSNPPLFASDRYAAVVPPGSTVLALPFATHGSSMLWQAEYRFRFRMADAYVGALAPADYARDLGTPPLTDPRVRPTPAALRRFLADRHVEMVLIDAAEASYWPQLMASTGVQPRKIGGVLVYRLDA